MDNGASSCYIDEKHPESLGLPLRHCGVMEIITAGIKHPPRPHYQVWIDANIRGITANSPSIAGWYVVFDLHGAYDLIVGKSWHARVGEAARINLILAQEVVSRLRYGRSRSTRNTFLEIDAHERVDKMVAEYDDHKPADLET
ncbi:hypothetical protein FN846DRAFT_886257 [Sphaerosporella brunnea]|uniref:Uncharacterized protein n=1 Tax=Sphaerosporella brunnea TaxID=1250544 RepID=A0A5J5F9Q3_9PEZI|nr:hypothetical protein FN846DRAFT_886257 [Sphaerosporella brunnea]